MAGFAVATLAALATAYGLGLPPGLARFAPHAESGPLALASIGAGGRSTTIIVSTPNSNDCRRYHLNMTTGARSEQDTTNCAGEADGPTRSEAISKSFRNR